MGQRASHLAGRRQPQGLAQLVAGPALLVHDPADEKADERHHDRQHLQLGHRHRAEIKQLDGGDHADLQQGRRHDRPGHALPRRGPDDGQEKEIEELEAAIPTQPERDPQRQQAEQRVAERLPAHQRRPQRQPAALPTEPPEQGHRHGDAHRVPHPELQNAGQPATGG